MLLLIYFCKTKIADGHFIIATKTRFEQFLNFAKIINLNCSRLKWCNFLHCDIFFARTWRQKHPACISLASLFNTQHLFSFVFHPLIWEPHSTACIQWALTGITEFWCILYIKGIKGSERETNNIGFLEVEITFFLYTFDPTHCTLAEGLQTWSRCVWAIWNLAFSRSMWLHSTAFIYALYFVHGDNPRPSLTEAERQNTEPLSPYHRIAKSSICNILVPRKPVTHFQVLPYIWPQLFQNKILIFDVFN